MNEEFVKMIDNEKSPLFDGLFSALREPSPTSVRLNPLKSENADLAEWFESSEQVEWEKYGRYLTTRPNFTLDPGLHQGIYYVQEASSMIHGEIVRRIQEIEGARSFRVLDSCASPGGKTTSVLAALTPESAVIANEFDYKRAEILRENIEKWGCPNVAVTRGSTVQFSKMRGTFDIILVDAPCSGEGMFRKSETAVLQWSPSLVDSCSNLQREIIENVYPSLRNGGYLIYSTCTFNSKENERNIDRICSDLGFNRVEMNWPEKWHISGSTDGSEGCYRFMPQKIRGEGLFVAVLKKDGELKTSCDAYKHNPKKTLSLPTEWTRGLVLEKSFDTFYGCTPALHTLIEEADRKRINFLTRGTKIAEAKGKDIVPSHALALSVAFNESSFPSINVSKDIALKYLRKLPIEIPTGNPKGYILLKYGNKPLGFINNLGNRVNNLLPKEWRIRI